MALKEGSKAPDFSLQATDGSTVKLSSLRGQKVILYFYPKDDTPGCTKEACDFQSNRTRISRKKALLFGISRDSIASHEKFSKKYDLDFPLLSDPDAKVCKAYGVYKLKSLYGRTYWGIERTTFIINETGQIQKIFPKVRVEHHAQEVIEALLGSESLGKASAKQKQSRALENSAPKSAQNKKTTRSAQKGPRKVTTSR